MAGQNTLFGDKHELGNEFGDTLMAAPATWYIGLSTDAPGVNATKDGGTFTEPSGNGYARVAVTNNTTNFPAPTGVAGTDVKATMTAAGPFAFPTPTGAGWGTINGFFFADAATAGNIWYYDDLSTPQTVAAGNTVSFASGSIIVTEQ